MNGSKAAEELHYVPLPAAVITQINKPGWKSKGPTASRYLEMTFKTADHRGILGSPDSLIMQRSGYRMAISQESEAMTEIAMPQIGMAASKVQMRNAHKAPWFSDNFLRRLTQTAALAVR